MEDDQRKVINERTELNIKITDLVCFLFSSESNNLTSSKRAELLDQLYIMMEYSKILSRRIENFI